MRAARPLLANRHRAQALASPHCRRTTSKSRHRRRYTIAHGALRAILAGYGKGDPLALEFGTGPRGKPFLAQHPELSFNLSHSAQLALIAVGARDLGIDLEKMRPLESQRDIARRHFAPGEFAALEGLPANDQRVAFYRCWTRKESYAKATGGDLSVALGGFDTMLSSGPADLPALGAPRDASGWNLYELLPADGYVGAVAIDGSVSRLLSWRWTEGTSR